MELRGDTLDFLLLLWLGAVERAAGLTTGIAMGLGVCGSHLSRHAVLRRLIIAIHVCLEGLDIGHQPHQTAQPYAQGGGGGDAHTHWVVRSCCSRIVTARRAVHPSIPRSVSVSVVVVIAESCVVCGWRQIRLVQQSGERFIALLHEPHQRLQRPTGGQHRAQIVEGQRHQQSPGRPLIESESKGREIQLVVRICVCFIYMMS